MEEKLIVSLKEDMGMLHDVFLESLDLDLSETQILELTKHFPEHIVFKGLEYGFSDTEVRDLVYEWAQKYWENIR